MSNESDMQERLRQLGAQFLQRTLGEVASLQSLLSRVKGGDTAAYGNLQHLAHRMHGTGATLGFGTISELAGELEQLVEDEPAASDTASMERLNQAALRLVAEVQAQAKSSGLEPG